MPTSPAFPFRAAYDALLPRIRAFPEASIRRINADVGAVGAAVLSRVPAILAHRAAMARLPDFPIADVDDLELLASATLHAEALHQTANASPPPIEELVQEGMELRDFLVHESESFVLRKLLDRSALAGLDGGNGRRKLGLDLIAVVNAVRPILADGKVRSGLAPEDLDRAEALGTRIVKVVAEREAAESQGSEIQLLRAKVFTMLVKAYDQVRRALAYLRHDAGDADEIAPSLFLYKRGRAKDEKDDNGGVPVPAPAKPLVAPAIEEPPISKDGPFR
jgi:hypothetical protein